MVLPIYRLILSEQLFCRLKFISIELILLSWIRIHIYDIKMLKIGMHLYFTFIF